MSIMYRLQLRRPGPRAPQPTGRHLRRNGRCRATAPDGAGEQSAPAGRLVRPVIVR